MGVTGRIGGQRPASPVLPAPQAGEVSPPRSFCAAPVQRGHPPPPRPAGWGVCWEGGSACGLGCLFSTARAENRCGRALQAGAPSLGPGPTPCPERGLGREAGTLPPIRLPLRQPAGQGGRRERAEGKSGQRWAPPGVCKDPKVWPLFLGWGWKKAQGPKGRRPLFTG